MGLALRQAVTVGAHQAVVPAMRFERCGTTLDSKGSTCILEMDHQFEHIGHDGFVWGGWRSPATIAGSGKFKLPTQKEREQDAVRGDVEGPST